MLKMGEFIYGLFNYDYYVAEWLMSNEPGRMR